jgi:hypothetical protein
MDGESKMNLQTQPNRASCMLVSLAICMDTPYQELFTILGHDGTEVLWPEYPKPKCYRGFHECEISYLANAHGMQFTKYEKHLHLGHSIYTVKGVNTPYNFDFLVSEGIGVLLDDKHAVACDHGKIYDPNGYIYDYTSKYSIYYKVS